MAGLAEEFFNQFSNVQDLIESSSLKDYYVVTALFGLYCGVLAYRCYRKVIPEKQELLNGMETDEMHNYEDVMLDEQVPTTSHEQLIQPLIELPRRNEILSPVEVENIPVAVCYSSPNNRQPAANIRKNITKILRHRNQK